MAGYRGTMGRLAMALEILAMSTGTSFIKHTLCSLANVQRTFFSVEIASGKDLQWNSTPIGVSENLYKCHQGLKSFQ